VTDTCNQTSTCEQQISFTLNSAPPQIASLPGQQYYGCVATDPRPLATATNNVVGTDPDGDDTVLATNLVSETRVTNNCEVTVERVWRVEDCCGEFDLAFELYQYVELPNALSVDALADQFLGCIQNTGQIPNPNSTLVNATSDCAIASISFVSDGQTGRVGCVSSFLRTYLVTDRCGGTQTTSQVISYILNEGPPIITTVFAHLDYGCAGDVRSVAMSQAAITTSHPNNLLLTTNLVNELRLTNGCQVLVERTWRVTDCCNQFHEAEETYEYTMTPDEFAAGGLPDLDLGCIANVAQIPPPDFSGAGISGSCGSVSLTYLGQTPNPEPTDACTDNFLRLYQVDTDCASAIITQAVSYVLDILPPRFIAGPEHVDYGCVTEDPRADLAIDLADIVGIDDNTVLSTQLVREVRTADECVVTVTREWRIDDCCGKFDTLETTYTFMPQTELTVEPIAPLDLGCIQNPNQVPLPDAANLVDARSVPMRITNCQFQLLGATADAYVRSDSISNHGTEPWLFTGNINNDFALRTYMRFDLSGLFFSPAILSGGCLEFAVEDLNLNSVGFPATVDVYGLVDGHPGENWGETVIQWPTAPGNDPANYVTPNLPDLTYIGTFTNEVSLGRQFYRICGSAFEDFLAASFLNDDVTFVFSSTDPTSNAVQIPSRENILPFRPQLALSGCVDTLVGADCPLETEHVADIAVADGCNNVIDRVYRAIDECGLEVTVTQRITYALDTEAPKFVSLPGEFLGCTPAAVPPVGDDLATIVVTDNCDTVVMLFNEVQATNGCDVTLTRSYMVMDDCQNAEVADVVYTWIDTPPLPTLTGPATIDLGCIPNAGLVPLPSVTPMTAASDCAIVKLEHLVDGPTTPVDTCRFAFERVYLTGDVCGQTALYTQVVTYVVASEPEILTTTPPVDYGCVSGTPNLPSDLDGLTYTGNIVDVQVVESAVTSGCAVVWTRSYRIEECCGAFDQASVDFSWTLTPPAPVVTGVEQIDLGCILDEGQIPVPNTGQFAVDAPCGAMIHYIGSGPTNDFGDCLLRFERFYEVIDNCNQTSEFVQIFTYITNSLGVEVTSVPANQDFGCVTVAPLLAPDFSQVTTVGNVASLTETSVTSTNGCNVTMLRTWRVEDCCGGFDEATVAYAWTLTPPAPTISGNLRLDLGCLNDIGQVPQPSTSQFTLTAPCGGGITFLSETPHTVVGCQHQFTRTYLAADSCSQVSFYTQTVTYALQSVPDILSTEPDQDFGCVSGDPVPPPDYSALVTSGNITNAGVTEVTSTNGCRITRLRTYRIEDCCGNFDESTVTFFWTTQAAPPQLKAQPLIELGCIDSPGQIPQPSTSQFLLIAPCGGNTVLLSQEPTNQVGCLFMADRIYQATDNCGQTVEYTQTITWAYDSVPEITATEPARDFGCVTAAPDLTPDLTALVSNGNVTNAAVTDVYTTNGCDITVLRTYRVEDCCGNFDEASVTFTYKIPPGPPTVTGPNPLDLGCLSDAGQIPVPNTAQFTVTAPCSDASLSFVSETAPQMDGCGMRFVRTYVATDECGLTSRFDQVVSYVIEVPLEITATEAGASFGCVTSVPVGPPDMSALVVNGAVATTLVTEVFSTNGCDVTMVRTYRVEDCCGKRDEAAVTFSWTQAPDIPAIVGAADLDVGCLPNANQVPQPNTTPFQVSGACSPATLVHLSDSGAALDGDGCTYRFVRLYEATDECGQRSTFTQNVSYVLESAVQLLGGNASEDFGCVAANPVPPPDWTQFAVSGTVISSNVTDVVNSNGCDRTLVRTYSVGNCCGLKVDRQRVFTWTERVGAPVITPMPVLDLGCIADPGQVPQPDPDLVQVASACTPPTVRFVLDRFVSFDGCGSRLDRIYEAEDGCGQIATVTQEVRWITDTQPPIVTASQAGGHLGCDPSSIPAADPALVIATDDCGIDRVEHVGDVVNERGCQATITRTYRVFDPCDNFADSVVVFTYNSDTIAPVISAGPGFVPFVDGGCNPGLPDLPTIDPTVFTVTDNCDDTRVDHLRDTITTNGCAGRVFRVYAAFDACGNSGTITQTFSFIVDNEEPKPSIVPADVNLGCAPVDIPPPGAEIFGIVDMCGSVTGTNLIEQVQTNYACHVEILRIYEVSDACGNVGVARQILRYTEDTTFPTLACQDDIDLGCNPASIPSEQQTRPDAADSCGDVQVVHVGDVTNQNGCAFTLVRTYSASDVCGNDRSCSVRLTWSVDSEPPVVAAIPLGGDLGCNAPIPAPNPSAIQATDDCGTPTVEVLWNFTNTEGCVETATRLYRVSDACGNFVDVDEVYTRTVDTTPPQLLCPRTLSVLMDVDTCEAPMPAIDPGVAFDACSGVASWDQFPAAGTMMPGPAEYTLKVSAIDHCGHSVTCAVRVVVGGDCGNPAIELDKTVKLGHGHSDCNGAVERLTAATGSAVTYCFHVRNTGNVDLSAVILRDTDLNPNVYRAIGNLPAGEDRMIRVETFMDRDLLNTAIVTGNPDNGDPQISDSDTAEVDAVDVGISLEKTVARDGESCVERVDGVPGAPVTFCFLVTNTGSEDLVDIVINDADLGIVGLPVANRMSPGESFSVTYDSTIGNALRTNVATAVGIPFVDGQRLPAVEDSDEAVTMPGRSAIRGVVWRDLSNDNDPYNENLAELGVQGATVELYDGQGNLIATTRTDANGMYVFPDQLAGEYEVRFPEAGLGMQGNETLPDGNDGIRIDLGLEDVSVENNLRIIPAPTAIKLETFGVVPDEQGAVLRWTTADESGVLGFRVLRDGINLTDRLLLAGDGAYQVRDAHQGSGTYTLVSIDEDLASKPVAQVVVVDALPLGVPTESVAVGPSGKLRLAPAPETRSVLATGFTTVPAVVDVATGDVLRGTILRTETGIGVYFSPRTGSTLLVE